MSESLTDSKSAHNMLDAWDPLAPSDDDVDMFAAAQKREIRNILKSYTGYYDRKRQRKPSVPGMNLVVKWGSE